MAGLRTRQIRQDDQGRLNPQDLQDVIDQVNQTLVNHDKALSGLSGGQTTAVQQIITQIIAAGGGGGVSSHNALAGKQGGLAPGEYYHLSAAEYARLLTVSEHAALRDNQPFGAGAVVYIDASGKLKTDAASFSWDALNKRLGIGTNTFADPITGSSKLRVVDGTMQMSFRDHSTGEGWIAVSNGTITGLVGLHDTDGVLVGAYSNHVVTFRTNNLNRMKLTATPQLLGSAGTAAAPFFSFIPDPNSGFISSAADAIGVVLGGVERLRITDNGTKVTLSRP